MHQSDLYNHCIGNAEAVKNKKRQTSCGRGLPGPTSRKKAIDDLVESLQLGKSAACEILRLLKGKGGDWPLYTKDRRCIAEVDTTFSCTYRNAANLYTLLEYMQDIAKKLD